LCKTTDCCVSKHRVVLSHFAYTKYVFRFLFLSKISLLNFYNFQTNIVILLSYSFLFFPIFLSSSAILVYDVRVYSSTILKQPCYKKSICSNNSRRALDAKEDKLSTAPRVVIRDFQERMAMVSLINTWLLRVSEIRGFCIKYF